jgi:hypothetical protein
MGCGDRALGRVTFRAENAVNCTVKMALKLARRVRWKDGTQQEDQPVQNERRRTPHKATAPSRHFRANPDQDRVAQRKYLKNS